MTTAPLTTPLPKFVDTKSDVYEFKSSWKSTRALADSSAQTHELSIKEVAVQSIRRKTRETQTEASDEVEEDIKVTEDDSPEFLSFLKRVSPIMLKELSKSRRSRAFDGYQVSWEGDVADAYHMRTLKPASLPDEQQVMSVSWNSTGSVIAVAFGRHDHEDWCTHRSVLCTWSLDRRTLDVSKPDITIDVSACLASIAFHPKKPALIAGGTFNGEVMIWDTSRQDEMLVGTSGIGDDSHREPVAKIRWMSESTAVGKKYNLISVGGDGKILIWSSTPSQGVLKLINGFILLTESLPRVIRSKLKTTDQEMGITAIAFSHDDETTFFIGSESGGIFRCSTLAKGKPARRDIVSSVELTSPVTFTYQPHGGPVYSIECSHFHRNMFLSCGTDASIRLYSTLLMTPVLTIEPNAGYLFSARWSPSRPCVFIVTAETGGVLVFDLLESRAAPTTTLQVSNVPVYALLFNGRDENVVAMGDANGSVHIWKLSSDMMAPRRWEVDVLDDILSSSAHD